ncbi:MAG: M67 family metallopeptidase [Thermomicrobiales bacterium]
MGPAMVTEIERHLRAALPNEGCGLLAGNRGDRGALTANRFFPGTNVDASPTRYTMSPTEVLWAIEQMDFARQQLLAIVHSHPDGPATPSQTDLREFRYPEALMVIADLSGKNPGAMILRAWRVDPLLFRPEEVRIDTASDVFGPTPGRC